MHVSRLQLVNIRCYAQADVHLSRTITLLAGENNTGKSTVLLALLSLHGNAPGEKAMRFGAPTGNIRIELEQLDPELFPAEMRPSLRAVTGGGTVALDIAYDRTTNPTPRLQMILPGGGTMQFRSFPAQQPDNLLVPMLSNRRAGGYQEQVTGDVAMTAGGTLTYVAAKVDRCLTSEELRDAFRQACKTVLGFVVSTRPQGGGKMAGMEISAKRNEFIPLDDLGSGVGQA